MVDSTESETQARAPQARTWLCLIYQLPPKPDYLRVKVQRRLRRLGARPLKGGVHVLPRSEESLEDFTWLAREIESDGGSAMICDLGMLQGLQYGELFAMWPDDVAKEAPTARAGKPAVQRGTTWVTRRGVGVDRMASAWLIRRFIDAEARFRFEAPRGYQPAAGELRFDMFDAEFTHEGVACTFETLVRRFGLDDPALRALGEIVHDIDCKDEKFGRPEAPGIALVVEGIRQSTPDDGDRVARGAALFEDLYARLRAEVV
jgi:hypothetical protein